MGKLTDTKIRAIKATGKAQRFSDGGNLYLYVSPTGSMSWRFDYANHEGKRKTYTIGQYPVIKLAAARRTLFELKEQLAQNIDPSFCKKACKESLPTSADNSFERIGREWFEERKRGKGRGKRRMLHGFLLE